MTHFSFRFLMVVVVAAFLFACKQKAGYYEYTEVRQGGGVFGKNQGNGLANAPFLQQGGGGSMAGKFSPDTEQDKLKLQSAENAYSLAQGISWTIPAGWTEQAGNGVRMATLITSAKQEVTLVSFPGDVGGIRSNLERWLGQVKINITQEQLTDFINGLQVINNPNQIKYFLVDFETIKVSRENNDSAETILAAIIKFRDQTLFVKLQGTIPLVNQDRDQMIAFLQSLQGR